MTNRDALLREYERNGGDATAAGRTVGVAGRTARRWIAEAAVSSDGQTFVETGQRDTWTATTPVVLVDDAIKKSGVDMRAWRVKKQGVTSWTTTLKLEDEEKQVYNWRVNVEFERRVSAELFDGLKEIHDEIAASAPPRKRMPKLPKVTDPHLGVIAPVDAHFGKLAWAEETGQNYDLDIARKTFHGATRHLLSRLTKFPIERFMFILGNDFLNVDSLTNQTTAGTPQDTDGRYPKIFRAAFAEFSSLIEDAIELAPVDIVLVQGNHDHLAAWHLAFALHQRYAGTGRVTIDEKFRKHKYYQYHKVLLGMTHGNGIKPNDLYSLMPLEVPDKWAATTHREWLTGHLHTSKQREMKPIDGKHGVRYRVLPAITGTDAYHYNHGYIGQQACEAYLYSQEGYEGHFNAEVRSLSA